MFKKVLIPTDFSEHAHRVSECISGIHGISEIILLHVIEDLRVPMGRETLETLATGDAETSLQKEKSFLETLCRHARVTPVLAVSSDVPGTILATAEKNTVDLIIVSAWGMGVRTGVLTGCVPTGILCRASRTNVLVMRHKIIENLTGRTFEKFCPRIFSRILCPADFSPYSGRAVALAGAMEGAEEIILLHIVPPDETGGETKEAARTANARLEAQRDALVAKGIRSRVIVATGDPVDGIVKAAEKEDVSVIWMGSQGKGCFHDFLLGSTVNDVVMKTKRPVIIIRAIG